MRAQSPLLPRGRVQGEPVRLDDYRTPLSWPAAYRIHVLMVAAGSDPPGSLVADSEPWPKASSKLEGTPPTAHGADRSRVATALQRSLNQTPAPPPAGHPRDHFTPLMSRNAVRTRLSVTTRAGRASPRLGGSVTSSAKDGYS